MLMDDMEVSGKYKLVRQLSDEEWKAFVDAHKDEWETVGKKISELRKALKVSKRALAREAGICDKTLTKLEAGKYIQRFKTVSKSCLNALAKIYYKLNPEIQTLIEG